MEAQLLQRRERRSELLAEDRVRGEAPDARDEVVSSSTQLASRRRCSAPTTTSAQHAGVSSLSLAPRCVSSTVEAAKARTPSERIEIGGVDPTLERAAELRHFGLGAHALAVGRRAQRCPGYPLDEALPGTVAVPQRMCSHSRAARRGVRDRA